MSQKVDVTKDNNVFVDTKEQLDSIGKGMCLAKWTQVTLQLQTGHNHSCHHPRTHKINTTEIARNPSALHNTCLLYTSPSPRDNLPSRMPSSA